MATQPLFELRAAPIGLQSDKAARHRRAKLVYRAACDAWMTGDMDEAQRLIDLWHQLQRPEGSRA